MRDRRDGSGGAGSDGCGRHHHGHVCDDEHAHGRRGRSRDYALPADPPLRENVGVYPRNDGADRELLEGVARRADTDHQSRRLGAAGAGVGLLVAGSAAGPDCLGAVIWIALCSLVAQASGRRRWRLIEAASPVRLAGGILGGGRRADRGGCWVAGRSASGGVRDRRAVDSDLRPGALSRPGMLSRRPASPGVGIRYQHRRSRVTQLANLAGVPVHATPLYSIAGNIVLGWRCCVCAWWARLIR